MLLWEMRVYPVTFGCFNRVSNPTTSTWVVMMFIFRDHFCGDVKGYGLGVLP